MKLVVWFGQYLKKRKRERREKCDNKFIGEHQQKKLCIKINISDCLLLLYTFNATNSHRCNFPFNKDYFIKDGFIINGNFDMRC